eukprot:SAG11_NODE_2525_length_3255_cov_1.657795_1_plen_119_part_00
MAQCRGGLRGGRTGSIAAAASSNWTRRRPRGRHLSSQPVVDGRCPRPSLVLLLLLLPLLLLLLLLLLSLLLFLILLPCSSYFVVWAKQLLIRSHHNMTWTVWSVTTAGISIYGRQCDT